jgi:hypothetical protein
MVCKFFKTILAGNFSNYFSIHSILRECELIVAIAETKADIEALKD